MAGESLSGVPPARMAAASLAVFAVAVGGLCSGAFEAGKFGLCLFHERFGAGGHIGCALGAGLSSAMRLDGGEFSSSQGRGRS